jgi:hypothetical protein
VNKPRIKANAIKTAANIAYYGGTLGAGVGMYQLMNQPTPIGIVIVLVFTLTVEGLISTMLTELLDQPIARLQTAAAQTGTEKGDHR